MSNNTLHLPFEKMSWSLCLVMIINEKEAPNTYIHSLKAYNSTCTSSLLAVVGTWKMLIQIFYLYVFGHDDEFL